EGRTGTPQDRLGRFVDTILSSTTDVWSAEFQKMGRAYQPPNPLVLYDQATGTQCGTGESAMGPFYCPRDSRVYLDLTFFDELSMRFGAPGDFAQAYVIAHEVGHHVQNLLGVSDRVERAEARASSRANANRYSVALELQADCYAGVWAAHAAEVSGGKVALESGDLQEGLRAAAAVGDDTLQKETQGRVVPDSFTHGSAAERQHWLEEGYSTGDPKACNTFAGLR
ncbi:MAG TPA: neutral zinc metallopeptidase, partial [Micropepsaceae bacterium]|nr:neutral zinc metallopeptidase [Micropepsaceae bacterium]